LEATKEKNNFMGRGNKGVKLKPDETTLQSEVVDKMHVVVIVVGRHIASYP